MANVTAPPTNIPMEVVHSTPGRVRLKARSKEIDIPTLKAITQQLQQYEGIYEVKLNYASGSIVVSFDVSTMSVSKLWEILEDLNISDRTPAVTLPTTETVENQSTLPVKTKVTLVEDLIDSLVPTIACMLVNQNLKISGWRSVPVSLITSKLVRGIMEQLKTTEVGELTTEKKEETPSFQVVHSTPGRVRLRVPQVAKDVDYSQRLEQLILTTDGVNHVRINRSAASVAIAYESHLDMLPYLANLLQEANLSGTDLKTNIIAASPEVTTDNIS
jgi:hypothetical protein